MTTTEMKDDNLSLSDTAQGWVQRVLDGYREVKPLVDRLARWRIVPRWLRDALAIAGHVLDALAGLEITARFKAGRDL
jgi:hypothetical protein